MRKIRRIIYQKVGFRVGKAPLLFLIAFFLGACSEEGGCSSCDTIEKTPFPSADASKTVPNSADLTVTQEGIKELNKVLPSVILDMMRKQLGAKPGSDNIQVCVPKINLSGTTICGESNPDCENKEACSLTFRVDDVTLKTDSPNKVKTTITLGGIKWVLPVKGLIHKCTLNFHKVGDKDSNAQMFVTLPIELEKEGAPFNRIFLKPGQIDINLDEVDFYKEGGGFICSVASTFKGILRNQLKSQFPVGQLTDKFCQACDPNDVVNKCAPGYSCDATKKICVNASSQCERIQLGVEGLLHLGKSIPLITALHPDTNLFLRAADTAEVTTSPNSITVGVRSGYEPTNISPCAPDAMAKAPPIPTLPIPNPISIGRNPRTNKPFHVGFTVESFLLNRALWGIWASGGLCLSIDTNTSSQVSYTTLSLLSQSLGQIVTNDSPFRIDMQANNPPTVTFGNNRASFVEESTNEGIIKKYTIESPLASVHIKDFDITFNAFTKDRWIRLFKLRLNVDMPFVLNVTEDRIEPVLGDIESAITDMQIYNDIILKEDRKALLANIKKLLGIMGTVVQGKLKSNEFFSQGVDTSNLKGFRLIADQDSFGAFKENGHDYLGFFLNIAKPTTPRATSTTLVKLRSLSQYPTATQQLRREATTPTLELTLRETTLRYNTPDPYTTTSTVILPVDLSLHHDGRVEPLRLPLTDSNGEFEYRYNIDNTGWSNYFRINHNNLIIESPILDLEGDHDIALQARYPDTPATLSKESVKRRVHIDHTEPHIAINDRVISVRDDISPETTELRYRILNSNGVVLRDWSPWEHSEQVDLTTTAAQLFTSRNLRVVTLEVEANDHQGNLATFTQQLEATPEEAAEFSNYSTASTSRSTTSGGCSTTDSNTPSEAILLIVSLLAILGLARIPRSAKNTATKDTPSRRIFLTAIVVTITSTLSTGCAQRPSTDEFTDNENNSLGKKCPSECECADNQVATCDTHNQCLCAPKPFALGHTGAYISINGNRNGVLGVATYNSSRGDLLFQFIENGKISNNPESWIVVDGQPDGVSDNRYSTNFPDENDVYPEYDAGKYCSLTIDDTGTAHIVYQGAGKLKYARIGSDGTPQNILLDNTENSGAWTQSILHNGQLHVTYSVTSTGAEGSRKSLLRYISIDPTHPLNAIAQPTPAELDSASIEIPCKATSQTECAEEAKTDPKGKAKTGARCLQSIKKCVLPDYTCSATCGESFVCYQSTCQKAWDYYPSYPQLIAVYPHLAVNPSNGELSLSYYNGVEGHSYIQTFDGTSWHKSIVGNGSPTPFAATSYSSNGLNVAYNDTANRALFYMNTTTPTPVVVARGSGVNTLGASFSYNIGEGVNITTVNDNPFIFWQNTLEGTIQVAHYDASKAFVVETITPPPADSAHDRAKRSYHGFYLSLYNDGSSIWLAEQRVNLIQDPPVQEANIIKYVPPTP